MKTAILVDGGFYRKRAAYLWGKRSPKQRANELIAYCSAHLEHQKKHDDTSLYRIFYYDCPPVDKTVYHPLKQVGVDFRHLDTYSWANDFHNELKKQRKVALRMGEISTVSAHYAINPEKMKDLCKGSISVDDLEEQDFEISFIQKGVDMKIGLDIASLAYKKQVGQIILIAGDSDFVPAAKLARREGIDFVLDPMGANIRDSLFEHIDGLNTPWKKKRKKQA